jgi:hypothetical protein
VGDADCAWAWSGKSGDRDPLWSMQSAQILQCESPVSSWTHGATAYDPDAESGECSEESAGPWT